MWIWEENILGDGASAAGHPQQKRHYPKEALLARRRHPRREASRRPRPAAARAPPATPPQTLTLRGSWNLPDQAARPGPSSVSFQRRRAVPLGRARISPQNGDEHSRVWRSRRCGRDLERQSLQREGTFHLVSGACASSLGQSMCKRMCIHVCVRVYMCAHTCEHGWVHKAHV